MSWDSPTPARLALIASLPPAANPPHRARLIGRVVGLDLARNLMVLEDQGHAVLVNLSHVKGDDITTFTPKLKDLLMVMGTLEYIEETVVVPAITAGQAAPIVSTEKILVAFMIQPCEQIDVQQWREAVKAVNGAT